MNTENNKLIAEFMGWPCEKAYTTCNPSKLDKWLTPQDVKWLAAEWMKFHTDWNWLMPVVEKIEGLHYKTFPIIMSIGSCGAYIGINQSNVGGNKYEGKKEIANTLNINYFINPPEKQYTKIEGVYTAVVQFIQWYNQKPHP